MQQELSHIIKSKSAIPKPSQGQIQLFEDYSEILNKYKAEYEKADSYFKVREPDWVQGWIIDISVIVIQAKDLLNIIIPFLVGSKIPFKIARNSEKAEFIVDGKLGYSLLGKIVSIYPSTEILALALVRELLQMTKAFRGPEILTDRHLGGIVYARYGACNPIIQITQSGIEEKFIYNSQGQLIKDPISIPFELPKDVNWPFSEITSSHVPKREKILQNRYMPMYILKEDAKGGVKKGLYLEKIWRIKWCVIKEGKRNMDTDNEGRDVAERLSWQYDLNKDLGRSIPMPKFYDFFKENGDTYLVMEFIKGVNLDQIITTIFLNKTLSQIPMENWYQLYHYAYQLLDIIERMHLKGYLHRDITPANFLVTRIKSLCLIDLELSYSLFSNKPAPPFRLGTPGFMSPEQEAIQLPTKEQDVYAIGGTLISLLTGMLPGLLTIEKKEVLKEQLSFFITDKNLINALGDCFDKDPAVRPTIPFLKKTLGKFIESEKLTHAQCKEKATILTPHREDLKDFITKAISGLAGRNMMDNKQLWVSKTNSVEGVSHQMRSFSVYSNFCQGISGVLFLLARAHYLGFSIEMCSQGYRNGRAFIQETSNQQLLKGPAGLYFGSAGIALALVEGIDVGLISDKVTTQQQIKLYLQNDNILGCGIVKGLAGKGMVLVRTSLLSNETYVQALLQETLSQILQLQQKKGYWIAISDKSNKNLIATGFGHGVCGVVCFLLSYLKLYKDDTIVRVATFKALEWLTKQVKNEHMQIKWYTNNKARFSTTDLQDGCSGVVLALIKAYEIFGESKYRQLAEGCLRSYLKCGISRNISLGFGLVGIGEVCLEAAKTFNSNEWQDRVDWIGQFLLHNFRMAEDDSCYWLADGTPISTAGFIEGNSGVIHFLLRWYQPGQLSHPLMAW